MTMRPTAGEPVKTMWLKGRAVKTEGSSSSSPISATWSSAKTSPSIFLSVALVAGVVSGILIMTRLPAASAVTSGPSDR